LSAPAPCDVLLADGGSAHVRAARPDDAPRLAAFHRALSLETVHYRYFSGLTELPPLILRRFTEVDFTRDMALVAEVAGRMIALASYHRRADEPDTAEVAFVVADEHQGRGLGTVLLERLAALARERGVRRFRADTLAGNRAMLRVFHDAGFEVARRPDAGVVHVGFPVAETPAARAAHDAREHLAEARSVARLLAPRALYLAGGRRDDGPRLRALGFRGGIHREEEGRDVPDGVDLALYAGAAAGVPALVAACARAHVHALALGALEGEPAGAERDAFEHELATAVRRNGLRLVGPGSLGLLHTAVGLCTLPVARAPARGALAFACDESASATALLERFAAANVGVSTCVDLGRRADVSANDLLQHWQNDADTRVVALALARCGNPLKFERIAARAAANKPLVALATGRAEEDARLARAGAALAADPDALVALARARLAHRA